MYQRLFNQARLYATLTPRGPLLIKSGLDTPDPTRPGMEFVRTRHPALGETIYLPGASLKGAVRSHAERVLRGLGVDVCDPLAHDRRRRDEGRGAAPPELQQARKCQPTRAEHETTAQVYKRQCPVCRTFGSLALGGRCNILDAYPWACGDDLAAQQAAARRANATERRVQVGISRENGSTHGGTLFDLEVAVAGEFHCEIHLQNFQLWQLGLLAAVLRDMDAGDVPLGFGKSRGLGQVAVDVRRLECEWVARGDAKLSGVRALCTAAEAEQYGLYEGDHLPLPAGCKPEITWRGRRLSVTGDPLQGLLDALCATPLTGLIRSAPKAAAGTPQGQG